MCGLCGNYDGNANNDFTTRSQAIAVETLDFVNSWKLSNCPDATLIQDPCVHNPYREAWAQRQCSIITSTVFSTCHSQVLTTNCILGSLYFLSKTLNVILVTAKFPLILL